MTHAPEDPTLPAPSPAAAPAPTPIPAPAMPAPIPAPAMPAPGFPPMAAPQGMPAPPVTVGGCEVCGAGPTLQITARGHRGLLLVMQFLRREGTFCRDCGTSITRAMSANTLVLGWWGIASVFITPVVLLRNSVLLRRLGRLDRQTPPLGPGLDPGRSLWRRPAIAGLLLPLVAAGVIVASMPSAPDDAEYAADARPDSGEKVRTMPDARPGDCWDGSSESGYRTVECTRTHTLQVYWVGEARTFESYREAGEKLVSGSAQADAACEAAIDTVTWAASAPDRLPVGSLFPTEEILNDSSSSGDDVRIVCVVDAPAAGAAQASLIDASPSS